MLSTRDISLVITTLARKANTCASIRTPLDTSTAAARISYGEAKVSIPYFSKVKFVSVLRWHSVEVKCGNLPCPPFVDDRELACVVCSLKSTVPGSAYVRWGSEACPSSTSSRLVYEGYAVGSSSTSTGGGANPLCLVRQPDWGQHSDIAHSQSTIVGAIYGTSGTGLRRLYPLNNRLILCAVCLAENASSTFTLPGSRSCPESYKIEYAGFLFAAYYSHKKSNWVCVEGDEARGAATGQNRKQAVWFPTEVECGGMKCTYDDGDYVKNREVSCSVCSSQSTRMSSTYAAWGRTSCDGGGVVVYRGFAAGGSRGETGNGANLLCMPTQSDYGEHNDKDQDGARLSGYEYKSGVRTNYEVRLFEYLHVCTIYILLDTVRFVREQSNVDLYVFRSTILSLRLRSGLFR